MGVDGASEVEVDMDEVNEKDGDVSESAAAGVFGMAIRHASTSADDDDEKANGDDNENDAEDSGNDADEDDEDSGDNCGTDTATEDTGAEDTDAEDTATDGKGAGACVGSVVIVCERGRPAGGVDIHSSASCCTTMAEVVAASETEAAAAAENAAAEADDENAKAVGDAAGLGSDDDSAIDVWKGEKAERARMRLL